MSSQRGNATRSRPQKNKNDKSYKKDLYGTTPETKFLDSLKIEKLCPRCTRQIEWRIKFKKYKRLTVPSKCTKCLQKTVKEAYHTICRPCAEKEGKCPKCCQLLSAVQDDSSLPVDSQNSRPEAAAESSKVSGANAAPRHTSDVPSDDDESDSDFSGDDDSEEDT